MPDLLTYCSISTKIRCMKTQLLTEDDYYRLAEMSSIPEAVEYLRQQPAYKDILLSAEQDTLHRGTLEQLLKNAAYFDFAKLYRFSNAKVRKYLNMHFLYFEAGIIKTCLQNIYDHRNTPLDLSTFHDFFSDHSHLDLAQCSAAESVPDLLEAIKGTGFYDPMNQIRNAAQDSLYDYEMVIDQCMFLEIWKQCRKYFNGKDLEILRKCFGFRIDLLNLIWIFRSQKYYDFSSPDIYRMIIPVYYKVKPTFLRQLIESCDTGNYWQLFSQCYYGRQYSSLVADPEPYTLEKIYNLQLGSSHLTEFRRNPFSIASVNTYLFLKHREYSMLTTMLECIRYGFQPAASLQYMNKYKMEVSDE